MKKYIVVATLILSLLFLLFNNKQNVSDKKPIKNLITTTVEDEYLWGLHSFHEDRIEAVSDEKLIIAGQNACSFLDEGYSFPNTIINLIETEDSLNQDKILANEVLANAVFTFCKEFVPEINALNP